MSDLFSPVPRPGPARRLAAIVTSCLTALLGLVLGLPTLAQASAQTGPRLIVSSLAYDHNGACGLMTNGTVYCWGANTFGQLGAGTSEAGSDVPVMVRGLSGVTAVVGNPGGYCAVERSGGAYCWGYNTGTYGTDVLGDGNGKATFSDAPVRVSGLDGVVSLVSGANGYDFAFGYCASLRSGYVKCWGSQSVQMAGGLYASGLLGDGGAQTASATPVTVSGIHSAVGLVAGQGGYCAVLRSTGVECWGDNQYNELGDGQLGSLTGATGAEQSSAVPVPVKGLLNVASVVSDWLGYCALLTNGKVRCWGNDSFGELGDGSKPNPATNYGSDMPVVVGGVSGAVQLVPAVYGYCARLNNGKVKCWGTNDSDALGDGSTETAQTYSDVPQTVTGVANAVDLSSNTNYDFCAVLTSGMAKCWGNNGFYELGNGNSADAPVATPVKDLASAAKIANGFNGGFYCAVQKNGGAACWGWNFTGELGAGSAGNGIPESSSALEVYGLGA